VCGDAISRMNTEVGGHQLTSVICLQCEADVPSLAALVTSQTRRWPLWRLLRRG
jgi:hypothetical protein